MPGDRDKCLAGRDGRLPGQTFHRRAAGGAAGALAAGRAPSWRIDGGKQDVATFGHLRPGPRRAARRRAERAGHAGHGAPNAARWPSPAAGKTSTAPICGCAPPTGCWSSWAPGAATTTWRCMPGPATWCAGAASGRTASTSPSCWRRRAPWWSTPPPRRRASPIAAGWRSRPKTASSTASATCTANVRRSTARTPTCRCGCALARDQATLYLDSSGQPLDHRGYRQKTVQAPVREQLAAAMVLAAGWDGRGPVVDPMCGSGTLLIEAAGWALGRSPQLLRRKLRVRAVLGFRPRAFRPPARAKRCSRRAAKKPRPACGSTASTAIRRRSTRRPPISKRPGSTKTPT